MTRLLKSGHLSLSVADVKSAELPEGTSNEFVCDADKVEFHCYGPAAASSWVTPPQR